MGMLWGSWACLLPLWSPGAWRTVAMVYAADPQTSPAYVTWAGHLTCPHPRLPQGPQPPAAPETVAVTSIVTAANGGLASVMSARVSSPHPKTLGWVLGEPGGPNFVFCEWASVSPHAFLGPSGHLPAPDPNRLQCHHLSVWALAISLLVRAFEVRGVGSVII